MVDRIEEDMGLNKESIFVRSLRKHLAAKGLVDGELENEIKRLLSKDMRWLADVISQGKKKYEI